MKKAPAHNKASTPAKTKLAPNETAIPLAEAGFVLFQFFVVCFFFFFFFYIYKLYLMSALETCGYKPAFPEYVYIIIYIYMYIPPKIYLFRFFVIHLKARTPHSSTSMSRPTFFHEF